MIKQAPPVGQLPVGPYPQASGQQLRTRARAKQAYQSESAVYPGGNVAPDISNIVAERQGPLLATREAHQIDFDKVAEQRQNVETLMLQQNKYVNQTTERGAQQEMDQLGNTLGNTLGSAY